MIWSVYFSASWHSPFFCFTPNWYPRIAPPLATFAILKTFGFADFPWKSLHPHVFAGPKLKNLIVQARTAFGAFDPDIILSHYKTAGIILQDLSLKCQAWKLQFTDKPILQHDKFHYSSRNAHSQNRTLRAPLLRNFVLLINGRPLRPADLTNFYASMKFVKI